MTVLKLAAASVLAMILFALGWQLIGYGRKHYEPRVPHYAGDQRGDR